MDPTNPASPLSPANPTSPTSPLYDDEDGEETSLVQEPMTPEEQAEYDFALMLGFSGLLVLFLVGMLVMYAKDQWQKVKHDE